MTATSTVQGNQVPYVHRVAQIISVGLYPELHAAGKALADLPEAIRQNLLAIAEAILLAAPQQSEPNASAQQAEPARFYPDFDAGVMRESMHGAWVRYGAPSASPAALTDERVEAAAAVIAAHLLGQPLRDDVEWVAHSIRAMLTASPAAPQTSADYSECCDTPSYCSSARRCTAKDAASTQPGAASFNYDPNMVLCGRMADQRVRLKFQLWDYHASVDVVVSGNSAGMTVLACALDFAYEQLDAKQVWNEHGQEVEMAYIELRRRNGDVLLCEDDELHGEDWLAGMLVGAEILSISPATRPGVSSSAQETRTVTIPARADHDGFHSLTVTLPWVCLHCGGPRGEPTDSASYDGSRRLAVHSWHNPCGHVELYSQVRATLATQHEGDQA